LIVAKTIYKNIRAELNILIYLLITVLL